MKVAKSNSDVAGVFGLAGGFLIGWPLGSLVGGRDPNWALVGIGAGLIAIGIPFSGSAVRHAKESVRIYNEGLPTIGINHEMEINLGFKGNGVAFNLKF